MISLIAALARNRVIGANGGLPWHLPEDSRHFRRATLGKPVVMGRKTFESMDGPLDGRENIVVSRQRDYAPPGCRVAASVAEALQLAKDAPEVMICGGEAIYRECLPLADRMYLTFVDGEFEGDAHFPEYDTGEWRELESHEVAADARHTCAFRIVTLERLGKPG